MTIKITAANFEEEVLNSTKPVLLDFWAEWCGPCQMVGPIVEEIQEEHSEIKVGKVNVDNEFALAQKFGIVSIPTLILIKNREIAGKVVGFVPKDELIKELGL